MSERFTHAYFGPSSSSKTDSSARFSSAVVPVGTAAEGDAGGRYIFAGPASAVIAAGTPVKGNHPTQGALAAQTTTLGFDGVAEDAFASGDYGWIKTRGFVSALLASGTTSGVYLKALSGSFAASADTDAQGIAKATGPNDGSAALIYLR